MDIETLKKIINNSFITEKLIDGINQTFDKYEINTSLRQSHFLSQIIHESGGFKYTLELASGEAYEYRNDLGNVYKGDGVKFKGRGLIQITGRNNYFYLSKNFGVDFIIHPELLEIYPYACLSSGWYWNNKKLNDYADKDDIISITKIINGGLNGITDRQFWLTKCKEVLL